MANKVFPGGSKTITVAAAAKISATSPGSRTKLYYKVEYSAHPDSWTLLTTLTANEQYVSPAFSVATVVRIDAGSDYVTYNSGILSNVGVKNGATVTAVETNDGLVHKTVLTLAATPVTITDEAGTIQWGGTAKVYDLPEGLITFLGCVVDGDLTLGTTGTITTTYNGDVALGTITATTGASLTATEADIMASNAISTAVAKVAAVGAVSAAVTVINGTATAKDVFLNFIVDDSATHTSGTGTFTGTITMIWTNSGDVV